MKAFVYRSGLVGMAESTPDTALEVGAAPEAILKPIVEVVSRHAYKGEDFLCPGVPEAPNDDAALDAVIDFRKQIKMRIVAALNDANQHEMVP